MLESSLDNIRKDFIDELKGYVPKLKDKLNKFEKSSFDEEDLSEFHRLVHTIKGASSLVKLKDLNTVAAELENLLDQIIGNQIGLNETVQNAIISSIAFFDFFSFSRHDDPSKNEKHMVEALEALQNLNELPATQDSDGLLAQLQEINDFETAEDDVLNSSELAIDDDIIVDDVVNLEEVIDFKNKLQAGKNDTAQEEDLLPIGDDELVSDDVCAPFEDDTIMDDHNLCADDSLNSGDGNLIDDDDDDDDYDDLDSLQEELIEGFYQEAEDHFQDLGDALSKLENQITIQDRLTQEHRELLRLIRRSVHTVKGAAAVVKLTDIASWGHEFEDLLDYLYEEADTICPETIQVMSQSSDILEQYVFEPQNVQSAKIDELRTEFAGIIGFPNDDEPISHCEHFDDKNTAMCEDIDEKTAQIFTDIDEYELDGECADINGIIMDAREAGLNTDEIDLFCTDDHDITEDGCEDNDYDLYNFELPQDELLEGFYQEAEDHFYDLGNALNKLENQITHETSLTPEHKELVRLIRRSVHTIKGAAAVVKLTDIASWGHEFEDLLDWLYEKADKISPEIIKIVSDATDVLEQYVLEPRLVSPARVEKLKTAFAYAAACPEPSKKSPDSDSDLTFEDDSLCTDDCLAETPTIQSKQEPPAPAKTQTAQSKKPAPIEQRKTKTLRIDMAKAESLVNLSSELIIALSAFDQNVDGLGNVIGELDQSRLRLKGTARDLEVGYEVKAIQHLGSHQSMAQSPLPVIGNEAVAFPEFDLLELDRYSEFNLIIRSLNETVVDVSTINTQLSDMHGGFKAYLNRLRILLSELQEKIMRMRMTPMTSILNRLRRTVRETAAKLDKKVRLDVHGQEIELDKLVWDKLADPLMHLLRNAIDHGIESPDQREALGKPAAASIFLKAAYLGNQVVITVTDDGRGLDFDAIRQSLKSTELPDRAKQMTEQELADMIFQPGLTTRHDISEISGRGIGMDVVKENISSLKGTVHIKESGEKDGTTFQIRIPLTLAVMQALLFTVNGRLYATSLYDIKEIVRVSPTEIKGKEKKSIKIRDLTLPFYHLSEILAGVAQKRSKKSIDWPLILVIDTGTWKAAVAIDSMERQRDIVIKSLGNHLHHVPGIIGATLMGDGTAAPILNIEELLSDASVKASSLIKTAKQTIQNPLEIMVVDDSVSVRMVVTRLMQRQGWKVQAAKDGVEALELLHEYQPDLVILDVEMPRMNGFEFMSAFRSQTKFQKTPVIMLTSRTAKKHRNKAKQVGVNGFMIKPYKDEEFIELIKNLSGRYPN
ncbi:MAG: response regulator [Desulfobacteraceae bacterium]|nr:response regulator [Desulfobacteraceae bacterium]